MDAFTLLIMFVGATIAALIAGAKQRNVIGWLIAGALFPLIAIIIVACLGSKAPSPDGEVPG